MNKILGGIAVGALLATPAFAVPVLQLDITTGSTYDAATQTLVATTDPFGIRALVDTDGGNGVNLGSSFYLSVAITPKVGGALTPDANFGSFTVNGVTYSASSFMQFGNPPVDATDKDLAGHGIFDTWYAEIAFNFVRDAAHRVGEYNTNPDDIGGAANAGQFLYFSDFAVNATGLNAGYEVHFDLYQPTNGGESIAKAPFSHDAESGGNRVPDGGLTIALLGAGMIGIGALRRRLSK